MPHGAVRIIMFSLSNFSEQIHRYWLNNVQKRTNKGVQSAKDAVFRGGLVLATSVVIIWLSIFLYTAFYYAYMPSMIYVRPVNLQFKSCEEDDKTVCSFPSAFVQLTKKQRLLMVGQPYKINLQLEMPESPANKQLGMFMVCAQLRSRDGVLVEHSCKSAMLHYRSPLLQTLRTLTFSPMMIFGTLEEKQNVNLELFGNFEEDQSHPVTIVQVEIQSRHVEFYSATLMINAHLSGLRYMMFHWPILSALVGIGTNLFFTVFVCVLSYLHFVASEEEEEEEEEEDRIDSSFAYDKVSNNDEEDDPSIKSIESASSLSSSSDPYSRE